MYCVGAKVAVERRTAKLNCILCGPPTIKDQDQDQPFIKEPLAMATESRNRRKIPSVGRLSAYTSIPPRLDLEFLREALRIV